MPKLSKDRLRIAKTRKVLREVVRLLNKHDRDLWNILTALRGPDDGNDTVKAVTSCQIRRLIGMKDGACGTLTVCDQKFIDPYGEWVAARGTAHFNSHYRQAIEALRSLGFEPKW